MAVAVVASCATLLTACGDPAAAIRDDISGKLETIKQGDTEFVDGLAESVSGFDTLQIDAAEFMDCYLEGFDYEVEGVDVDGDTATAHVAITCKSFSDILGDYESAAMEIVDSLDIDTMPSDEEIYAMAGEAMMDATEAAEVKSTDCEFTYTRGADGTWSCDEAGTVLTTALYA